MNTKQIGPPTKDRTRIVQVWTPGAMTIDIREEDILPAYREHDDEAVAHAYCKLTGLRVTVKTITQTTFSPIKLTQGAQDV